jgi:PAP2 superfamily
MYSSRFRPSQSLLALILTACSISLASPAHADAITDWNAITADTLLGAAPAERPNLSIDFPMVHIAMFDAVNAIDRRYTTYIAKPTTNAAGASKDAAAVAAAYTVLRNNFPSRQTQLDSAYLNSIAAIPADLARDRGIAVGTEVGKAVVAWRANDGRLAAVAPYVPGTGPGAYQLTPPGYVNPVATYLPGVRPLAVRSASQFRAYGPPALSSERFAADFNETKQMGSATSMDRTAAQTEIGRFHTENPTTFWARNLDNFVAGRNLSTTDHARAMAQLWVSFGDSNIGCFDSKYHFNFWRPVTAIQTALDDGNPATQTDPTWVPLAVTPPHPEYPAAHGCATGAIAATIEEIFGENTHFVFTSKVPGTVPHAFDSPEALVKEVINARIYGGMHYRTSGVHGARLGKLTAEWVAEHYFRKLRH